MSELPEIDRYTEFAMSLPAAHRKQLGRLLQELVARDGGGWTIQNQAADEFLERHRSHLETIIESDYGDEFHAED